MFSSRIIRWSTGTTFSLVMQTLTTIGGVAAAMGPAVKKASKGILSDVLKCLTNNIKHMREFTLAVVDKMILIPLKVVFIDLFDCLTKQVAGLSDFVDATHLLKPASNRSDGPTRRSAKNSGRMPFRDLESQWTRHGRATTLKGQDIKLSMESYSRRLGRAKQFLRYFILRSFGYQSRQGKSRSPEQMKRQVKSPCLSSQDKNTRTKYTNTTDKKTSQSQIHNKK
ncbi:unnamed protein product [Arabidopsis thaliana]|uniref:Uncharacterized protein n=1 Tax=Arabidopsis thaliana TaxID=3702 RepID=Q9LRS1_ARATH|nr:unnamed protein product [Arabidopsis thaliana]